MLRRLSSAIKTSLTETDASVDAHSLQAKFPYSRPAFLGLSLDGEDVSSLASYNISRPVLVGGDRQPLPGDAGYAETINAGKSALNEDQSQACQFLLLAPGANAPGLPDVIYENFVASSAQYAAFAESSPDSALVTYFGMFDGHAGDGAATFARHLLHLHVKEKLAQVYPLLLRLRKGGSVHPDQCVGSVDVSFDELVIGALETAFLSLDEQISRERTTFSIRGGCTALVAVFLLDRVYIANAGDTRAVLSRSNGEHRELSCDHTPHSDRQRIQMIAAHHPQLLQAEFCPLQFYRRLGRRDLGNRVLCRHARTTGWFYKSVTEEDLLFPLIMGDERKSRLMATIGVARGFGDHDLKVFDSKILIKPFLSCVPEVQVLHLSTKSDLHDDVIIMATDGLWDVLSSRAAADIVQDCLQQAPSCRHVIAAQQLVGAVRGTWHRAEAQSQGSWRLQDGASASMDDVSCFVLPAALNTRLMGLGAGEN